MRFLRVYVYNVNSFLLMNAGRPARSGVECLKLWYSHQAHGVHLNVKPNIFRIRL